MFPPGVGIGAAKSKGLNIILRHKFLQCYIQFNIYTILIYWLSLGIFTKKKEQEKFPAKKGGLRS